MFSIVSFILAWSSTNSEEKNIKIYYYSEITMKLRRVKEKKLKMNYYSEITIIKLLSMSCFSEKT